MGKEDIFQTAFVTPDGTYEFLRMPLGMKNSGATLVRGIREVLSGMSGVESYIDDLIVFSSDWKTHMRTLEELLKRLSKANLTARPSKCIFGASTVEFLTGSHRTMTIWTRLREQSGQTRRRKFDHFVGCLGTIETIFLPLQLLWHR